MRPAYAAASDWPRSVKDGLHAFLAFLATNPSTAKIGGLNLYSGGPRALALQEQSLQAFGALLDPGFEQYPLTRPVSAEAIGGTVSELVYGQLRFKGAERLYEVAPAATFVALTPFTGVDRACAIANEGWHPAAP